jgi:ketosteroid isomerase-like protein
MRDADAGQTTAEDLRVLRGLNEGYIRSVGTCDAAWFEENLAPDFMNSNPDGTLVDRAGFVAQVARPSGVPDLAAEDVRIRIFGGVAIIHGRTVYTKADGRHAGRYTDIWARLQGRWLCVAAHVTRG